MKGSKGNTVNDIVSAHGHARIACGRSNTYKHNLRFFFRLFRIFQRVRICLADQNSFSCFPWRDFILALFLVIVLLRLHTKHITYFELPPCVAGPFKNIYGNPNSVAIMLSVSSFIRLKNVGIV